MAEPRPETGEESQLRAAGDGRREVLARLLEAQRERLLRMVDLRLHPRLRARLGASDVLQDAWIEGDRIDDWLRDPSMPFALWVRFLTAQRLVQLHRFHLGAQRRAAGRERAIAPASPEASSATMAQWLADARTTPTQGAARSELRDRIERALGALEPMDREVLAMRHFEGLTNAEVAAALGIEVSTASKRYVRALDRLRDVLDAPAAGTEAPGA